ncbi:Mhp operon transcriptional activator [Klebsiella grimontii]|nr:Mhp operon transcriptional activator [Klebsiella grimontii]
MDQDASADYKTVRGLSRGLLLLNLLNKFDGGATVGTLAEFSGLHRTTVRRLLETLQDEGYVRRSRSDDSFRLTIKVRQLSEGFRDEHWISALATPLLGELLREVLWPTDITTLDVDAMVVRETTHRFSRLSFHRAMVGRRLPLLLTASGLTWLAFAPEHERSPIVEMLAAGRKRSISWRASRRSWPPSSNAPGKTATVKTFAAGSRRRKSPPLPSPFAASCGLSAA